MASPKEPPGLSFDLHNEWIERHIALLSSAGEAGAYGGSQLVPCL